jgi:hypothetical protein
VTKRRVVQQEKGRKYTPWRARLWIDGERVDLGHYKSREAAEAACHAVRKVLPAKGITKGPLPEAKRAAILQDIATGQSQGKTAKAHGVSKQTVWKLIHRTEKTAALGRDPREPIGDCW